MRARPFSAALMAVGAAASLSTLLKNEANCSLADTSSCTFPRIGLPVAAPAQAVGR